MEEVVNVKGLSAELDGNLILSDVSFSAGKGEVTVIIGGSGSGKTTLLRHLTGLYPVQNGSVTVLGRDISMLSEKEMNRLYHEMGVFYQHGALLNSLTVGENVAMPLLYQSNLPKELIGDIVRMKLGLVNLKDTYDLYPSQLSGGMLKRVALARAIAMDPPLLFCDEPGAGLDPVSLESLDNLILMLKDLMGISVILVTHEVSSILRVADRIVFLHKGRVIFQGELEEALKSELKHLRNFFSLLQTEYVKLNV